nr:hypothetical protein [Tanacetum cinerariifolium]
MMVMIVNNDFRLFTNRNRVTIRTMMYPDVHENPLTNDEFEAYTISNDANMNDLQFKLDNFQKNQRDFQEKYEQMQDDLLNQMRNFMQNFQNGPPGEDKEHEATTDTELSSTEDILPLPVQEPPQNSDICQLIREECFVEVPGEQKQNMENTMLDLIKSQRLDKQEQEVKNVEEQPTEHRNQAEKSLQNFRVIHKSSIYLKDTSQISSVHAGTPILSTKEPKNSLSMGYEHLSITPEMESNEVTESNAKNLLPIPSECEVTLEDKRECDELVCKNPSTIDVCDNHSEILFDSNNDDLSSDDESFEDIEYVDASVLDPAIASVEENVDHQEQEEINLEEISQVQDVFEIEPDQEELFGVVMIDIPDNSSNDPLLEEVDLVLFDDSIPPGIENVADDPEGDIRFLEELLINDSILSHESSYSNFEDNPSILRPPPKPPDDNFDLEPEVISAVMEDIDEPDEHFNPGGEIFVSTNNEDVDYFPFMFVI